MIHSIIIQNWIEWHKKYDSNYIKLKGGLNLLENQYSSFAPSNEINQISDKKKLGHHGFFSAQGNYNQTNDVKSSSDSKFNTDNDSAFSYSDASSFVDMMSSSEVSSILPKIKKKITLSNKHLENLNNDNEIIDHLKKCDQCKKKVIDMIIKNSNEDTKIIKLLHAKGNYIEKDKIITRSSDNEFIKLSNDDNIITQKIEQENSIWNSPNLKDIIILIVVGIVIIIVLDLVIR